MRSKERRWFLYSLLAAMTALLMGCLHGRHRLSKRAMRYEFPLLIEDEASGKPAFPRGNTWQDYWAGVFDRLRTSSSHIMDSGEIISCFKTLRSSTGLA